MASTIITRPPRTIQGRISVCRTYIWKPIRPSAHEWFFAAAVKQPQLPISVGCAQGQCKERQCICVLLSWVLDFVYTVGLCALLVSWNMDFIESGGFCVHLLISPKKERKTEVWMATSNTVKRPDSHYWRVSAFFYSSYQSLTIKNIAVNVHNICTHLEVSLHAGPWAVVSPLVRAREVGSLSSIVNAERPTLCPKNQACCVPRKAQRWNNRLWGRFLFKQYFPLCSV
jgi:hypothetical protein